MYFLILSVFIPMILEEKEIKKSLNFYYKKQYGSI